MKAGQWRESLPSVATHCTGRSTEREGDCEPMGQDTLPGVGCWSSRTVFTDEQEKNIWWYLKQAWVIIMSQTGKICFIKEHVNMREKTRNREGGRGQN